MSQLHTVKQGEHAATIAEKYGFADFDSIWNDPKNEELRGKRTSPNVLAPGDEIYIPDFKIKQIEVATGKSHKFVIHRKAVRLKLRLLDAVGDPLANLKGELEVGGATQPVTTDGDGVIEAQIPNTATSGTLKLEDLVYDLAIGHLDPEDMATGAGARLVNLGYRYVEPDQVDDFKRRPELNFAVELFAKDEKVDTSNGQFKPFLEKLRQVHGS